MFRVGMKVVRIGSGYGTGVFRGLSRSEYSCPQMGEVVTIATINEWPTWTALTFVEHDNSHLMKAYGVHVEPGFNSEYFRPVVERKTDISIFQEILRKHSKPAPVSLEPFPQGATAV